jgi:hypothetical protein
VVVAAAALFEGLSFTVALHQFLKQSGTTPFWEALHRSKDPTTYTVLAEDAAALVGLAFPAIGIARSYRLNMPELDGVASLLIGVMLAAVATLLTWESRGLLIGEGVRPETARAIRGIALTQPKMRDVGRVLSMYVGPGDALVTMDLDFDEATTAAEAAHAITNVERQVRGRFPMIKRLFIESGSAAVRQRWSRPDAIRLPSIPLAVHGSPTPPPAFTGRPCRPTIPSTAGKRDKWRTNSAPNAAAPRSATSRPSSPTEIGTAPRVVSMSTPACSMISTRRSPRSSSSTESTSGSWRRIIEPSVIHDNRKCSHAL